MQTQKQKLDKKINAEMQKVKQEKQAINNIKTALLILENIDDKITVEEAKNLLLHSLHKWEEFVPEATSEEFFEIEE